MNTVIINDKELKLNSGLDEPAFGKTNYYTFLSQEGLIFDGTDFTPWTFDNIVTEPTEDKSSEDRVYYCGNNPLSKNAKTLLSCFLEMKQEELYKIVVAVTKAMTIAAEKGKQLPLVGAGGILIDNNGEKILFLPENIFKYSTNPLSPEEYFIQQTAWVNFTITGIPAICYERSVIVYKFLTGRFPYPAVDETVRNQDILDRNFLPLGQCIDGINIDFAKQVNNGLRLNSTSVAAKGKKKQEENTEETTDTLFNFDLFDEAWQLRKTITLTDEELAAKAKTYLAAQKARIETQRKLRKYFAAFMVSFFVALGIILLIFNTADKQNSTYTSKGLTSTETLQGFFYGVNNISIELMDSLVKGEAPEKYVSQVQEIYLIEKQIAGFTSQGMYYNPAQWMFTITDDDKFHAVRAFGITNLTIDGQPQSTEIEVHRKNQKPEPVTSENGVTLAQDDTVTHTVEYYLLQTNPDNFDVIVTKQTEEFTLTYTNQKWLITDISTKQEIVPVNTEEFKTDYFTTLSQNENDIITATELLKDKYQWLPTNETMLNEQSYLISNY